MANVRVSACVMRAFSRNDMAYKLGEAIDKSAANRLDGRVSKQLASIPCPDGARTNAQFINFRSPRLHYNVSASTGPTRTLYDF